MEAGSDPVDQTLFISLTMRSGWSGERKDVMNSLQPRLFLPGKRRTYMSTYTIEANLIDGGAVSCPEWYAW